MGKQYLKEALAFVLRHGSSNDTGIHRMGLSSRR